MKDFRKTWKQKIWALCMMVIGLITTIITKDATLLVFSMMLGIPIIMTSDDVFDDEES